MSYKNFFKGKRVAIVGVGEAGSMLPDIKFLAKLKVKVSVYDMRSRERLGGEKGGRGIVGELETMLLDGGAAGQIISCTWNCAVGDFAELLVQHDLIILGPEVPKNSRFLRKATEAGIQIEHADILFFKLIPPVTLIGVIGSVGKTAVAGMLEHIFDQAFLNEAVTSSVMPIATVASADTRAIDIESETGEEDDEDGDDPSASAASSSKQKAVKHGFFFVDPETTGALHVLKKIKKDDIVIARMPEHLMDEYRVARVTPHVAVITHVSPSRIAKTTDAQRFFGILEFQTYNTFIVASDASVDVMKANTKFQLHAKIIRTRTSSVPVEWNVLFANKHMRDNAALVYETAQLFKINPDLIRESLECTRGMSGRLERVKVAASKEKKKDKPITFYNDSASIRPESTLAALRSLSSQSTILIFGGAYTGVSYDELFQQLPKYISNLILIPGSGTLIERLEIEHFSAADDLYPQVWHAPNIASAVKIANDLAKAGDQVLFSPGCDAGGIHGSREERGRTFISLVKAL